MMELRPYQSGAVAAVWDHLRRRDDNPCVVIPTAGGKTHVMAQLCKDAVGLWQGRVLILAHVKELLEQAADKLTRICPDVLFGVYSAGLRRRDTTRPVILAGIQSVYQRACELGAVDLAVVDEAHLIPPEGDGMYRQFLADARVVNPHVRTIGLTATPFRLKSGMICTPDGVLNHVCCEVGVYDLITQGFLCRLVSKAGRATADTSGLHTRAGEFVADEVEALMDADARVESACAEIVEQTRTRNAVLIFSSGVRHGGHIVSVLKGKHGIECGFVTGATPLRERDALTARFRAGDLKYLCNINVLTTGFDAPNIDCVALVRPTMSPGLYYQMVGRGFRLHPAKANCLVLDFGGNVLRHGPVDQIRVRDPRVGTGAAPVKECPGCQALVPTGCARCPECGFLFPEPERVNHDATASAAPVLSGQAAEKRCEVLETFYSVHTKRGAADDAPKTMRVEYKVGFNTFVSEWLCFEHEGYAWRKAAGWWRRRSPDPVPGTAAEAVDLARQGRLAPTHAITVRRPAGEEYDRVVGYQLGDVPAPAEGPVGGPPDPFAGQPALVPSHPGEQALPEGATNFPFGYNVTPAEEDIPW
jgi:DNA repair protein RadD